MGRPDVFDRASRRSLSLPLSSPLLRALRAPYHGGHRCRSHGCNDGRRFLCLLERVGCHLCGVRKPSCLPGLETGLDPEPPVEVMDAGRDMVARVDYSLGRCQVEEPLRVSRANSQG
jgi:hypothetical protein